MTLEEDQSHRKWMETLLNSLPSAVIVVELGTARILYANASALASIVPGAETGTIEENAECFRAYEARWRQGLYAADGHQLVQEEFPSRRVARGESFSGLEVNWKCPVRGEAHTFLCSGTILPAAHGRPAKGIVSYVEVTDRVEQREALKKAIAVRDEFLTVASHELRTPISSITLSTQSLLEKLDELDKEEIVRRLQLVGRATNKLNTLVENLLDVSRIARPTAIKLAEADLCEVVKDAVARHSVTAKKLGVEIHLDVPVVRMRGNWDVTKLDQIIGNLLSNALKYGGGMPVDVKLFHTDSIATIDVRDHGIGVSPKDRERIFQRFERAVPGSQYPGMGIGLWLSKEMALAMGGNIELFIPENGHGSIFRLSLPLIDPTT